MPWSLAAALGITERTVKAHRGRVFRRTGVVDRTSAALWARDHLDTDAGTAAQHQPHPAWSRLWRCAP